MSQQETLTVNAPRILDANSSRRVSTSFAPLSAVRLDLKRDVRPDINAADEYLPFIDGAFDMIYYDPPHIIENPNRVSLVTEEPKFSEWFASVNRHRPGMAHQKMIHSFKRFGFWPSRAAWLAHLAAVNIEFRRCLTPDGILMCKLGLTKNNGSVKLEELLAGLTNFKETARKQTSSNSGNPTYWLTMALLNKKATERSKV